MYGSVGLPSFEALVTPCRMPSGGVGDVKGGVGEVEEDVGGSRGVGRGGRGVGRGGRGGCGGISRGRLRRSREGSGRLRRMWGDLFREVEDVEEEVGAPRGVGRGMLCWRSGRLRRRWGHLVVEVGDLDLKEG